MYCRYLQLQPPKICILVVAERRLVRLSSNQVEAVHGLEQLNHIRYAEARCSRRIVCVSKSPMSNRMAAMGRQVLYVPERRKTAAEQLYGDGSLTKDLSEPNTPQEASAHAFFSWGPW